MKRILTVGIILLAVLASISASGANLEAIKARASDLYFGRGVEQDYRSALNLYLQAAQAGDPEAQYIAGGMYYKGYGTPVDFNQAFEWIYRAARNGKSTPESQRVLAQSFLLGRGTPKSFTEARRWYSIAAENGDPEALNELGFMYFVGNGVEPDAEKAFELFMSAAQKGLVLAQFNVGIMLFTGMVTADAELVDAYTWMSLAATGGNRRAVPVLQYLETTLSPDELVQAQSKARSLYDELKGIQ